MVVELERDPLAKVREVVGNAVDPLLSFGYKHHMLQFKPGVKRIVRPSAGCVTMNCEVCGKFPQHLFVEPSLDGTHAILKESVCVECGQIFRWEGGKIGGKPMVSKHRVPMKGEKADF